MSEEVNNLDLCLGTRHFYVEISVVFLSLVRKILRQHLETDQDNFFYSFPIRHSSYLHIPVDAAEFLQLIEHHYLIYYTIVLGISEDCMLLNKLQ
jgi:hypothetical protein